MDDYQNNNQYNNRNYRQKEPLGFGKTMLASAVGVIIAGAILSFIGFLLMAGMMVSMMSSMGSTDSVTVKNDTFLKMNLSGNVRDAAPSELETLFAEVTPLSVEQILTALNSAKNDERIKGVYVKVGVSDLSWGNAEELRQALIDFQSSGKPVVVYGETYTQPEYYMATACKNIYLHPAGAIDFRGIGAEPMFYKDLFDKLGIHMELVRPTSCDYKTAGETYTMNHMSAANREQIRVYINSIWDYVANNIAKSRDITFEQVNKVANNLSGYMANGAKEQGLVDRLCFENDVKELMNNDYKSKHTLSIAKYAQTCQQTGSDQIAVIYAEGNVQSGQGQGYGTGVYGDAIASALDKAAKNDKVKAIVLRVNSPGGVATASEVMTDAVIRAKKKKPVVVSMGDLAASAGYEMSCMATKIVAQPTTITGSIGVFGTIPEVGTMLSKKLGITTDTVQTNANSTALSTMRPLSPTARALMQQNVEDFYVTFTSRVAEGRQLPKTFVDSIARGRVWTGRDALQLGLVDTLGGLPLAIELAAQEAGVSNYYTVRYPAKKDLVSQLSELLNGTDNESRISLLSLITGKKRLPQQPTDIEGRIRRDLEQLSKEPTLQARLPYYLICQ